MMSYIRKYKFLILITLIIVAVAVAFSVYSNKRFKILNKSEYNALTKTIKEAADEGKFYDQDSLTSFITSWADEHDLKYSVDKSGNIIFIDKAVKLKKKVSPTVVLVSTNYETAGDNARLLASAAMIAATDLNAGRKTVIFVNDEQNTGDGYVNLSKKLFKNKPKVIYLDYGSSAYMSNSSFGRKFSTISVKAGRYEPDCDTAVKIHISGIDSAVIGTGINKHPDPIVAFSSLLTRLKSKSTICQIADFEVGTNGNMYPVSLDATIMLNSYAASSFTKYIDKQIKAWEKSYGDEYENLTYTYEVIDEPDDMPKKAYSAKATARLTNVLYTLKSGLYKYDAADNIPEGRKEGEIYGINAITGLRAEKGSICIDLMTQAYDDEFMQRIIDDNTAAAVLFDASFTETGSVPRFLNDRDSLYRTFNSTFFKVNGSDSASSVLRTETDNYFTPCSYIAEKNKYADIIHIRMNSDQSSLLTNTILCYIAYKGNFLF